MSHTAEVMIDGRALDAAMLEAFYTAVRRHRQANVPMVFSSNGTAELKSPFEVQIPEDTAQPEGN